MVVGLRYAVEESAYLVLVDLCQRLAFRPHKKGPRAPRREPHHGLEARAACPGQGQIDEFVRHHGRFEQERGCIDRGGGASQLDAGVRLCSGELEVPASVCASEAQTKGCSAPGEPIIDRVVIHGVEIHRLHRTDAEGRFQCLEPLH